MKKYKLMILITYLLLFLLAVTIISGQNLHSAKFNLNKTVEKLSSLANVYVVIELDDYLTDFHKELLREFNVSYIKPIGGKSYIFLVPSSKIEYLANINFIKEVKDLESVRKKSYFLQNNIYPAYAKESGTDKYKVIAEFYKSISFNKASVMAEKYGKILDANFDFNQLIILIKKDRISQLVEEENVKYVTFINPPPSAGNNGSRRAISADVVQQSPYRLNGQNIDIGIWDGGKIDNTHDDFGSRVKNVETSGNLDPHATHVAGTLGGEGILSSGIYKGVATDSKIYSYNYFVVGGGNDPSSELNGAISNYGIEVSQNSWGDGITNDFCSLFGYYDTREQNYDEIVRGKYGKKISIVFITHNFRDDSICNISQNGGYDTVTAPGTAKNVISVGATNSDDDSMTSFSGWGPTDDGRIKPDVVAPGCEDDNNMNTFDPSKSIWSTKSTDTYGGNCGTSMAAPTVSGTVALMYQQFQCISSLPTNPLPSTIKALLLHTAKDLGATGPDYKYGYGRVNATEAIDHIIYRYFREDNISSASEADKFNFTVNDSSKSIKVTLVWDDKEGTVNSTKHLINDLDLYLKAQNGTIFKSWTLDPNNPSLPATKNGNHRDNVEQVVVDSPAVGTWTIIVNATSCPECLQTYSLVYKRPWEIKLFPPELGSDAGWNFFSVPVKPYKNITELFQGQCPNPNVARIYEWDAKTQGWTTHIFCDTLNTLVGHLKPGHAYLILNATGTLSIPVDGDPITNVSSLVTTPVQLYIGNDKDNHVSFNSFFEIPTNESIKGLNITKFWQYKGGKTSLKRNNWDIYYDNETFEQAEFNLRPGAGLRIYPKNSFNLTIPQTRSCSSLAATQNTLSAASIRDEPFVVYGSAHCIETLNKSSQNVTIRLRMGSAEITNYTMGEVNVNQYRLQVPVGEAGINVNDTAEILINNVSAGNVTVGESGELVYLNITANSTTDLDGDNFSGECSDCNDTNPNINPNAQETCSDGIDNNCNGNIDCADSGCASNDACLAKNITVAFISTIFVSPTERIFEVNISNNGQASLGNVTWSMNLGDGTSVNSTVNASIAATKSILLYVDYNYSSTGDYIVTVNASDNNLSASLNTNLEVEYLGVSNFSVLNSSGTLRTFEAYVKNYMAVSMTNVSWSLSTGNGIVSSTSPITLQPQEVALVFVAYNYTATGTFAANFTTVNSSWNDLEALNVTIT